MKYLKVSALGLGLGAALVMYSCGGGGGGGTTSASTPTVTPATSSDIQNATSLSTGLETVSNLINGISTPSGGSNTHNNAGAASTPLSLNQSIKSLIYSKLKELSKSGKILAQGTSEGTYNCQNGGTVTVKYSWTNPNCKDPSNDVACRTNNDIKLTFIADKCNENGLTYNGSGSLELKFDDKGKENYVKIYVDSDLTVGNNDYKDTFFKGFNLEYNRIDNNTYKFSLNGNYKDYDIKQNESCESQFKTVSLLVKEEEGKEYTINGGIVFSENGQLKADMAAQNLTIFYNEVGYTLGLDGQYTISRINGYLYDGSCTKKWYKFETLKDIKTPVGNTCPTEGQLRINGNLILTATSNGGITTSDGKTFNSCKELESKTCNVK